MIIPIGTDVRLRRRPLGNWGLVALNVLVYLAEQQGDGALVHAALPSLYGAAPSLNEYLTYQFRHGDIWHLAGNMLFLWIFGNAVCDRMGSINYVLFYLAGGVFAGIVFAYGNNNLLLGASGAIAAVTTAFLVLYPRVHVTMLIWFILLIPLQLPAMIVIAAKIILWDNIIAPKFDTGMVSNVAYSAHLGGYSFGLAVALAMLFFRALPRNQFDLLALLSRWRRRTGVPGSPARAAPPRSVDMHEVESRPLDAIPRSPGERLREDILDRISEHDLHEAARLYVELRQMDTVVVLPRNQQLEIANHFSQANQPARAVDAYEAFLDAYPTASDAFQIRLLAGLVCRRYLADNQRAAKHLRSAASGLTLESQRELALAELALAEAHLSGPERGASGTTDA